MSHFDGIDVGEGSRWSAATPMMARIEATLRRFFSTVDENGVRIYEAINLNTGDSVCGFNSTEYGYELTSTGMQRDIGFVIHDTGGTDTIDFPGSTAGTMPVRPTGRAGTGRYEPVAGAVFVGVRRVSVWRAALVDPAGAVNGQTALALWDR